jgi:sulfatase maturation enzyme AslB (radical SAM superfamily)
MKNNIKSLSISVPATGCINDCKYCVSKMKDDWKGFGTTDEFLSSTVIKDSIQKAIDNGVKSIIITGTVEPLQNMEFVHRVCKAFKEINPPTVSLEIQTSLCYGAMTIPYIKKLAEWGVDTLAVSVSALDERANWGISGISPNRYTNIDEALTYAKNLGMNIRLCINMSKCAFAESNDTNSFTPMEILSSIIYRAWKSANQITIRRLYHNNSDTPQANWIKENEFDEEFWVELKEVLSDMYIKIGEIDWYDVTHNLYIRVDEDCMGKQDESRYWVLRPDGKLYQGWDATTPIREEE